VRAEKVEMTPTITRGATTSGRTTRMIFALMFTDLENSPSLPAGSILCPPPKLKSKGAGADTREESPKNPMRATGLLNKAQSLRDSSPHLRVLGPGELAADPDQEITPEERAKVLAQIDEAVARSRAAIGPAALRFRPRRRGGTLPLLVNLIAVVAIAAGVGLALYLSRESEGALAAGPATLLSAEGKVLEAMREESRRQLEGKDREIASIRDRLAGIDQERERIRREADDAVRRRAQELEQDFARSLQTERSRLSASGLSEEAVARKMVSFEANRRASVDEALAAAREQSRAEIAEKEKTIEGLQAEYRNSLAQAQAERGRLQDEASRRQSELEAGFRQKQMALEKDKAAALAELDRLRRQSEREQMAVDQLLAHYGRVQQAVQAGRPEAERAALAELRRYLDEPVLAALPAISRRRPVDIFLVDSLDDLVRSQESAASAARDMQGLVASANLVTAVASLVQEGDALFQEQSYAKAREAYLSALARIPAVQAGHDRLAEIDAIASGREKSAVTSSLAAGSAAYRAGDYDQAVERYGAALRMMQLERGSVDSLVSQLMDIGSLRRAAELTEAAASARPPAPALPDPSAEARTRSAAWLAALRAGLTSDRAASEQVTAAGTTLVALLETKLLVQQVLLSPEVSAKHPDLFDRLERYLQALAEESRGDARLEILRDLDEMLRLAAAGGEQGRADAVGARYPETEQRGLFLRILDRLQGLLK
jgi:hypothetical protein